MDALADPYADALAHTHSYADADPLADTDANPYAAAGASADQDSGPGCYAFHRATAAGARCPHRGVDVEHKEPLSLRAK